MSRRALLSGIGEQAPAASTTNADAEMIALCKRLAILNDEFHAITDQQDAIRQPMTAAGQAEWNRLDDMVCAITCQLPGLERQIASRSAITSQGIRAKARATLYDLTAGRGPGGEIQDDRDAMAYSLAQDIFAMTEAQPSE